MNKGRIYKLYNEYGTYYGSTTKSLKERFCRHSELNNSKCISKILFKNGAIPKLELLEEVEFNDIKELRERERYYIENLECINLRIPNRTRKEYLIEEKEKRKQTCKKYNDKNKLYYKQWRKENKEQIAQQRKEYYETNKQIIIAKQEEKRKIKITCECGTVMRKDSIYKHKKTKKHLKYIEEKNSTIII